MILGLSLFVVILLVLDFIVIGWLIGPHRYDIDGTKGTNRYWPGVSFSWFVLITTAVLWIGGFNVPMWIWNNPMSFLTGAVGYGVIGIVWSIFHWWLWRGSEEQRERLAKAFEKWKNSKHAPSNEKFLSREEFVESSHYPYGWKQNFPMILTWVLLWPFDVVLYLLGDFVYNLATAIGRRIVGIYSSIGDRVDRSVLKD